jgi:hypothetical protein
LERIPEAQMLFDSAPTPIAPSVIAEIAPQSPLSKEAAERILSYWAESQDGGEKDEKEAEAVPTHEYEQGIGADFDADTLISAADYLAPDDVFKGAKKNEDDDDGLE